MFLQRLSENTKGAAVFKAHVFHVRKSRSLNLKYETVSEAVGIAAQPWHLCESSYCYVTD